MQELKVVKSPRRTSSRGITKDSGDRDRVDDEAVLYGYGAGSSADEQDSHKDRRRTTITRMSHSASIQAQLSQEQSKIPTRPLRSRSTTEPPVPSRPSTDRFPLPPIRTTSSSRSPAVLSMHKATGSVSTVSTSQSQSSRSLRSRSHTESSGGTSITRPSLDSVSAGGRKSTSSMWSQHPMPVPTAQYLHWNRAQTAPSSPDFSESTFTPPFPLTDYRNHTEPHPAQSPVSPSADPIGGWRAMARKASGKFRRSPSTNNVPMEIEFSAGSNASRDDLARSTSSSLSPKAPRSRSKTVSAPSSDAETESSVGSGGSGLLGGFLSRKKSSNSLRAEKAERNRAWSQLPLPGMSASASSVSIGPTSPTQPASGRTLRHKSSKLSIGTGKGKQRLDEVVVSPFDVHFHSSSSASTPLKRYIAEPEDIPRPSLSSSLRPHTPPPFKRSLTHDSSNTARHHSHTLRAPMPRSQSTNSTASSSPCSPSSSHVLSPSMSTASLTSSSSLAWDDEELRPPVPPVPEHHRSESPGVKSLRFPTSFGFVPRPEEEEEDDLGSSASAAAIPAPLLKQMQEKKKPKKAILDFDAMLEEKITIKIKVGEHGEVERNWM